MSGGTTLDPVALQVMTGALRAACDEMGAVLIRSAHSPNITERHDCSTALFDPAGELVMQAEHIPVHLGSMPDAVAAIVGEEHHEGDLWILNDPYRGGTHLPDITVITPVFLDRELIAFAANRAHHADVGGPTPGSMRDQTSALTTMRSTRGAHAPRASTGQVFLQSTARSHQAIQAIQPEFRPMVSTTMTRR